MKWLTKEQVREYATTPERALDISIEHHQQNVDATEKQLVKQGDPLSMDLCGLCWYYRDGDNSKYCGACPLVDNGRGCYDVGMLYYEAHSCHIDKNHKRFIKAETALLNRLKQLKSGDKSMDKKEELKIKIEQNNADQERLRDEHKLLETQLAESEVTYSIGDRFKKRSVKHLLVLDKGRIVLVSLETGQAWNEPESVKNWHKITEKEFEAICGGEGGCFPNAITRYWDARKKVRCD